MFTGIIEALGAVVSFDRLPEAARLAVSGPSIDDVRPGDSVAINGVCLTAAEVGDGAFVADVMRETLQRSALDGLAPGDPVNLERAVTPSTRLGGHIVQGHVDGVAVVAGRRPSAHWHELDVALPAALARYVVEKGSIAIDGVSLTVAAVTGDCVTVSLVPETLARTTLGVRQVGDRVNVEVDVLAKYVERLLAARETPDAGAP